MAWEAQKLVLAGSAGEEAALLATKYMLRSTVTKLALHRLQQHLLIPVKASDFHPTGLDRTAIHDRSYKIRVVETPGILEELPLEAGEPGFHLFDLVHLPVDVCLSDGRGAAGIGLDVGHYLPFGSLELQSGLLGGAGSDRLDESPFVVVIYLGLLG